MSRPFAANKDQPSDEAAANRQVPPSEQTAATRHEPSTDRPAPARRPLVGREIRRRRTERGLTLSQVAERSGLNIGYLSQIENDKASPSLDALAAIGGALDVPIAWFLIDGSSPPRVVRAGERRRLAAHGGGSVTDVDGGLARDLRIVEATAPPGMRTGVHSHTGDEHHIVTAGRWRFTQGDSVVEIGPGDYLVCEASVPHDVECISDEPCRVIIVYPRRFATPDAGARRPGFTGPSQDPPVE
jgi:transcriptional regulator with XRE-family HTH domain